MNAMKFLVHESFEFEGVCTWQGLSLDWLVGSFYEKMKFVVFEM